MTIIKPPGRALRSGPVPENKEPADGDRQARIESRRLGQNREFCNQPITDFRVSQCLLDLGAQSWLIAATTKAPATRAKFTRIAKSLWHFGKRDRRAE